MTDAVGDAGLLVPPRDPVALAQAGLRLVRDAALRQRLERAVGERCEGALCWRAIAGETLEVYAQAQVAATRRGDARAAVLAPALT